MEDLVTGYSVKYLFTKGILVHEKLKVRPTESDPNTTYLSSIGATRFGQVFERLNSDVFLTMEEAQAKAKDLATRKKRTLLKKIAKIEKDFGV